MTAPARIAVVGARGHGVRHRTIIHQLQSAGRARLVAVSSRSQVTAVDGAPLAGVAVFDDYRRMLASTRPDVVVVATPPHVHLPQAMDAAAAGCDMLLEKPPVVTQQAYADLAGVIDKFGVACQVGFQALASPAMSELRTVVRSGLIGEVRHLAVAGAWWRPDSYYHRSDWAGRRLLAGQYVADGALSNQFSHGVMQVLALIEDLHQPVDRLNVEFECYRTRSIEVEDTACLRLTTQGGPPVLVAVTLSASDHIQGELAIHGSLGTVRLEYPTDRVLLPGKEWRPVPHRPSLLKNLLDHRDDRTMPLVAPLSRTRPIVPLLEAIHHSPPPVGISQEFLSPSPDGDGHILAGAGEAIRAATQENALFSELSIPWSRPPHFVEINVSGRQADHHSSE